MLTVVLTVLMLKAVSPVLLSWTGLQDVPDASRLSSSFAFFSSPPAAANMTRALEVIITSRWRFLVVAPPKNLENFFDASSPPFDVGLCAAGEEMTIRFPNLMIRSLLRVRTGDQSMSS
jgi:hypothetical protein